MDWFFSFHPVPQQASSSPVPMPRPFVLCRQCSSFPVSRQAYLSSPVPKLSSLSPLVLRQQCSLLPDPHPLSSSRPVLCRAWLPPVWLPSLSMLIFLCFILSPTGSHKRLVIAYVLWHYHRILPSDQQQCISKLIHTMLLGGHKATKNNVFC